MGNELMKKAYEHFGGVWPYDDSWSMIVRTNSNSAWGEGIYDRTDCDNKNSFKSIAWQWVGTKDDFNWIGTEIHKSAPEGATHESNGMYFKFENNRYYQWVVTTCDNSWFDIYPTEEWITENLTPLQAVQWLPEVGHECECESGYANSGWELCTFEGSTRVGNVISCDRHPLGKLISKEVKFRPIKTERDEFIERGLQLKTPYMWTDVDFLEALYDNGFRFNG